MIAFADLEKGQEIGRKDIAITRAHLVRYAGASGDFNPIHYNDVFAQGVDLPGVIAHGMFTMGAAVTLVEEWIGDPGRILDYSTGFTGMVPVPNPGEAVIAVTGVVAALDDQAQTARVDLTVTLGDDKVLGRTRVTVRI